MLVERMSAECMPVNILIQLADSYAYFGIHLECPLLQEVSLECSKQILNSSCGHPRLPCFSYLSLHHPGRAAQSPPPPSREVPQGGVQV